MCGEILMVHGDFPPVVEGLRDQRVVVFDREELGVLRVCLDRYWTDLDNRRNRAPAQERESILSLQHTVEAIQEKLR